MYKIGAFSNITQLTVKALRYYHDEGLLEPKEIDKITNYRLYTADQIPLARAIKLLRVCEFSIKEIKEIIHECDDLEDLPYFMDEKIGKINTDIQHLFNAKQRLEEERNKCVLGLVIAGIFMFTGIFTIIALPIFIYGLVRFSKISKEIDKLVLS